MLGGVTEVGRSEGDCSRGRHVAGWRWVGTTIGNPKSSRQQSVASERRVRKCLESACPRVELRWAGACGRRWLSASLTGLKVSAARRLASCVSSKNDGLRLNQWDTGKVK